MGSTEEAIARMLNKIKSQSESAHWLEIGDDIYTPDDVQAVSKRVKEIRDGVLEQYRLVDAIALTHAVRLLEQMVDMLRRQQETDHLREILDAPQTLMPIMTQEEFDAHLARGDDVASAEHDATEIIGPVLEVDGPWNTDEHEKYEDTRTFDRIPLRPLRDNPQA